MPRQLISSGSPFEQTYAYSRAVAVGDWCFTAGTTGYDYAAMRMPDDPAEQCRNALTTIQRALAEAGFELAHVVRTHVIVTDARHWEASAAVVREFFSDVRPANTTYVAELMAPEMKIEIEATAYRDLSST